MEYKGIGPYEVYLWMPYEERLRRIALGAAYWLAVWNETPDAEPTLI